MGIGQEFKAFVMRGNVVDLAVGVIIGGAFGRIVSALVEKVLMPPLGLLIGGVDFTQLKLVLKTAGANGQGEVAIGYGDFIQTLVNFIIIAFCVFIIVKLMHELQSKAKVLATDDPKAPPPLPEDILLLREIRDSLKSRS